MRPSSTVMTPALGERPCGPVLNVAAYAFVTIVDTEALRNSLWQEAQQRSLLGTVLIAEEGINLFLAGQPAAIESMLAHVMSDQRFHGLDVKRSESERMPFRKLMVKVKREIIRMNRPQVRPDTTVRAQAIEAQRLKRWLDQGVDDRGRPVVMLDTRNDFEVSDGHFNGAMHWSLSKFSDFPDALARHVHELRDKTVVSYCTGGIRCEKAALLMQSMGLEHSYQLDGGILRYFETVGQAHWQGECFVFDAREPLDVNLRPRSQAVVPSFEAGEVPHAL